jgi:hypothetical protein
VLVDLQAVPRKIWLDPSGKQLLQWPVEEVEKLRGKPVTVGGKVVKPGEHSEVTGHAAAHQVTIIPKSSYVDHVTQHTCMDILVLLANAV